MKIIYINKIVVYMQQFGLLVINLDNFSVFSNVNDIYMAIIINYKNNNNRSQL